MEKRVALVTGATGSIGRAVALQLARLGMKVWLGFLSHQLEAEDLQKAVLEAQGSCDIIQLDVRDPDDCQKKLAAANRGGTPITVCVCCAGIVTHSLMLRTSPDDWDNVVSVNLNGFFNTTRAVLRDMIRLRSGSIVALGSIHAGHGLEGHTAYIASKAGLSGAVRSLAREMGNYNVRVNLVSPGWIYSPQSPPLDQQTMKKLGESVPLRRPGTPQEVAGVIGFLCSDKADYITGATVSVAGGLDS
jgi:3-oxoacyl-[acyl-carrier protein] reductase